MPSIFIAISSYRDLELGPTILNAVEQSSRNNEIYFGVHVSYIEESEINVPDIPNLKYIASQAPKNLGVGSGRSMAHKFYSEEDYYLQCDSHTRFVKDWDEILIKSILDYQEQGIEKPLLSMYPSNYWYKDKTFAEIETDTLDLNYKTLISFHEKPEDFKELRIPSQMAVESKNNIFTRSVSAGFIFTTGPFIAPNKDMAFWGEEIMIAARAYTHGYDLLLPSQQCLYHLYYNHLDTEINRRKIFWQDFPDLFQEMNAKAREVVYKTLTKGTVGKGYLGTERSLSEYGVFAGLDFVNGEIVDTCQ